jgi:hypothetical protein
MAYDFKRDFTSTFTNGVTTPLVTTSLRTLHALFGPKFETSGGSALSDVTTGNTAAAVYPGLGVEGFGGPIGLRLEAGTGFSSRTEPTTTSR